MKVKCDERWPHCSPCIRSGVECSGPPSKLKFVHNGRHSQDHNRISENSETVANAYSTQQKVLVPLGSSHEPSGATFARFRISSGAPRPHLTTVADRVAARLITIVTGESASKVMLVNLGYIKYLPSRLQTSVALRDSINLMMSGWVSFMRGDPIAKAIDLKLYLKAIRSLQKALDGPESLRCETLAATTILERFEVAFDGGGSHRAVHASGVRSLTSKRGPPNLDDEMDVLLALKNQVAMVRFSSNSFSYNNRAHQAAHLALAGGDNFYLKPPWREVMREAIESRASVSTERREWLKISFFLSYWPELTQSFGRIHNDSDPISKQAAVESLLCMATQLHEDVRAVGNPIIDTAYEDGRIVEQVDDGSPLGVKAQFNSVDSMPCLIEYTMICIIINRVLHHLRVLQGKDTADVDAEHRHFCRRIWMTIPSIREEGTIAAVPLQGPMYLSYEGTTSDAEKDCLLDFFIEVDRYKRQLPEDRAGVELYVLNVARVMTGQLPLNGHVATS